MTMADKLTKVRNFLVPNKRRHRMVKDWCHSIEDAQGNMVYVDDPEAVRFCALGAGRYLFPGDHYLRDFIADVADTRIEGGAHTFQFIAKHTVKEVREFFNLCIKRAQNMGVQ